MRRSIAAAALLSLALAACGGSASNESAAVTTPAPSATPLPTDSTDSTDSTTDPTTGPPADTTVPPAGTAGTTSEAPDELPGEEAAPATEPAQPEFVWPDDGCSADNSPTPAAAADGPTPVVEVRPESADGPLPDLAVRRINCKGGWENLRNELPSEQPLLVWFWAPH